MTGLEDGKVRALNTKTNKSQNLYETQSMVVAIAANERGTGFICGHDDGSIIRFYISEDTGQASGRLVQHQTSPVALAWANNYIVAAGCDRKILFYDSQVRVVGEREPIRAENKSTNFFSLHCAGTSVAFIRLFARR